jgi:acylglycerol lipase
LALFETQKFRASDGFVLAFRHWKVCEPRRVILCLHGLGDYSGWFSNVAEQLGADGSEVYALDLRGFGESVVEGSPRGVVDFKRHFQDIDDFASHLHRTHVGKKLFLFGHSLGSVYSLWYAANHRRNVDGLVLAAPAIVCDIKSTCSQNRDPEEIAIMKKDPLETCAPPSNYLADVQRLLMDTALPNARKIQLPTLIIHGDADVIAQVQGARDLYAALAGKDKDLVVLGDMGHWFDDALCPVAPRSKFDPAKRRQFITLIREWLRNH